jgi:hypothetical protein
MDLIPQGSPQTSAPTDPTQGATVPQGGAPPDNGLPDPDASVGAAGGGETGLATGSPADMAGAAGIMPTGTAPNPNPTPGPTPDADGSIKATPAEQAQYNQMLTRAKLFIHGKQSRDAVINMLNVPGQPAYENIGRATANIVQMIEGTAQKGGQQLSQDVLVHGGMAIVQDLMTVAKTAGILGKITPDQLPHLFQLSVLAAVKNYGNTMIQAGNAPTADAKNFMASMVAKEHANGSVPQGAAQNLVSAGIKSVLANRGAPARPQ